MIDTNNYSGTEIAIIGISGRFPSAGSVETFWNNLSQGKECVQFFNEKELQTNAIDQSLINNPNYIKAKAQIDDVDMFDAQFFGYTPRIAECIDPQQRLFLECAWKALEDAGYSVEKYNGLIGVYAGVGLNNYYNDYLANNKYLESLFGKFEIVNNNNTDFLSTRVSYKLNLKGPSLTVQTACSTSLVAVHLACQNLLLRECDIALAGGSKVIIPRNAGYLHIPGGITSSDGHCKPFDSNASGFVPGEGVGVVALKRLEDCIKDRDFIYAVIRGSAINNDGSDKIGFTAPSIIGQSKVISNALAYADIDPNTISYIEAHGTGTNLGDPIELEALKLAFNTNKKQFCAIGSVKSNIGHLDSSAGIAGLIKSALMLKYKKLVPSINFESPNPKIDFKDSPFYVNTEYKDWIVNGFPRRAGISSFGIGGTNAHVVLEEAPQPEPSSEGRRYKLITLSAKTKNVLENYSKNLLNYFEQNKEINLSDAAYTLNTGRSSFPFKQFHVAVNNEEVITDLKAVDDITISKSDEGEKQVVFMFSGQGSQYVSMAKGLYETEFVFKKEIDNCLSILSKISDNK